MRTLPSAEQMRLLRERKGLSQADLARMAGVAIGTIRRVESGQSIRPKNMHAILTILWGSDPSTCSPTHQPSQDATALDSDIAQRLLHFLENRRVLCAAWEDEHIHAVIASVEKIRQKLEDLLDEHPHASISPILQNLQECTWPFSDFKSFPPFRIFDKTTHALQFNTSLYNLRGEFIEKLGELGSMTHISMEDLLNRIRESLNTMRWLN